MCAERGGRGSGAEPACGAAMSQGNTSGQGRLGDTPPGGTLPPPAAAGEGRAATERGGGAGPAAAPPAGEEAAGGGRVPTGNGGSRPSPRPRASFVRGAGVGHGAEGVGGVGTTVSNGYERARQSPSRCGRLRSFLCFPAAPHPAGRRGCGFIGGAVGAGGFCHAGRPSAFCGRRAAAACGR